MPTLTQQEYDEILARTKTRKVLTPKGIPEPKTVKGHKKPGRMNKTEARYAAILEAKKQRGTIKDYWYEKCTWKLTDDCRYTIDFLVLTANDELEGYEVKGAFIREDAMIKLRVAADQMPFPLFLCQYKDDTWTTKRM